MLVKNKVKKMTNTELLNELISLYSKDSEHEKYYKNDETFNKAGMEYAELLREESLSRMIDNNAKTFNLFGVRNNATGRLISDITNPRHKYWERKNSAESAINNSSTASIKYRNGVYNKDSLEVVTIKCAIQENEK